MLLAINTCLRRVEAVLINEDNGVIVSELSEASDRNHTEKIFEFLETILKKNDSNEKGDILNPKKVLVVTGPGAFTSIRVGVVTANTIAFASKAQMYSIDLSILFAQEEEALPVFISAGKSEIYELHETDNFIKNDIAEFVKTHSNEFYGDINDWHLEELKKVKKEKLWKDRKLSFGEAMLKMIKEGELEKYSLEEGSQALPTYLKPPNISISKKKI